MLCFDLLILGCCYFGYFWVEEFLDYFVLCVLMVQVFVVIMFDFDWVCGMFYVLCIIVVL